MANRTITLSDGLYDYLLDVSLREPDVLRRLREETAKIPAANMQIAPEQGQFMALLGEIAVPQRVYRWGDEGENPYYGYLAVADAVIVTGDSVSMCSEACATTGPVYIYAPEALITAKHARLHSELFEKGYARPLAGRLETWTHAPLNPAGDVARAVRERMPV